MKSWDILDFEKGGNLRKGVVNLQKREGYDSPHQLCSLTYLQHHHMKLLYHQIMGEVSLEI